MNASIPSTTKKQMNKMKNLKSRLTAWIGLLAVCLWPMGAPAAGHHQSGIIGHVGERGMSDGWTVVVSENGKVIADLQTGRDGFFEVDLPPGNYVLTPFYYPPPARPGHPTPDFVIEGPSTPVTVVKNRFTFVVLPTAFPL